MIEQQTPPASPAAPPYLAIWVTTMAVFPLLLVLWGFFVLHDPFALVLVFLYPYTCVLSIITFLPALISGWWVARCIGAPGVSECALFVVAVVVHYLMFACVWDYVGKGQIGPPEQVIPGAVAVLLFLGWIACRKGGVNAKK